MKKHLELLGLKVEDCVTGFKGIVSSVSFDLYGCVQAIVSPGVDKEGNVPDGRWLDITRLKIVSKKPVMALPDYISGYISDGRKGAAEKPKFNEMK